MINTLCIVLSTLRSALSQGSCCHQYRMTGLQWWCPGLRGSLSSSHYWELVVVLVYVVIGAVSSCVKGLFVLLLIWLLFFNVCFLQPKLRQATVFSLCERVSVCSILSQNKALATHSIPLILILYCSCMLVLIARSLIWFGCFLCNSLLQWSHCCLAFLISIGTLLLPICLLICKVICAHTTLVAAVFSNFLLRTRG